MGTLPVCRQTVEVNFKVRQDQLGEVPFNILQPALEAASLQEDPDMQTVWANLLANAADPRHSNPVLPSFANMLKELTSREIKFLEGLVETMLAGRGPYSQLWADYQTGGFARWQLLDVCSRAKLFRYAGSHSSLSIAVWKANEADLTADNRDFEEMMGILKRNAILDEINRAKPLDVVTPVAKAIETRISSQDIHIETETFYKLSVLGTAFVNACRPPAKAEMGKEAKEAQ
jgi:hypothetical protein